MNREASSDPLPFVQIDRALAPKAAMIAAALGVTVQHAIGSLYQWWVLLGDPRELEAIVEATPEGQTPERVVTVDRLERTWTLASNTPCPIDLLTETGLIERRPTGYRVRGMSRQFSAIVAMRKKRSAAVSGGKARAAMAARAQNGRLGPSAATKQPRAGKSAGKPAGELAGESLAAGWLSAGESLGDAPAQTSPDVRRQTSDDRRQTFKNLAPAQPSLAVDDPKRPDIKEPTTRQTNTNGAVSTADRSKFNERAGTDPEATPPPASSRSGPIRSPTNSDLLCADYREVLGADYLWLGAKDGASLARLLKAAPINEIRARWRRGLEAPGDKFESCRTVAELSAKWNRLVPTQRERDFHGTGHGPIRATLMPPGEL